MGYHTQRLDLSFRTKYQKLNKCYNDTVLRGQAKSNHVVDSRLTGKISTSHLRRLLEISQKPYLLPHSLVFPIATLFHTLEVSFSSPLHGAWTKGLETGKTFKEETISYIGVF